MVLYTRDTRFQAVVFALVAACLLGGCGPSKDVKTKVDKDVYGHIDRQWKDEFGPRTNYRVSDVAPSPNDVNVAEVLPDRLGTLTIPQAVALATGRNRDYQTQREVLYATALNLRLTRHQFEQQYFGVIDASYRGDRNDHVVGVEPTVGFNRLLADGTVISANIAAAWAEIVSGNLRGGLASILGVSVFKPLMRGSGRDVVMEGLTQAQRDLLYEVRTFNHFRKGLVVSVISDYYATLVLQQTIQNAQSNQQAIMDLLKLAVPLSEGAVIPTYEVDRIRQELLLAEVATGKARRDYEEAVDQFKLKLGVPPTILFAMDPKELDVLMRASLPCPEVTEKEILNTALALRLDVANAADRVIDAQRKIAVAKDRLRGSEPGRLDHPFQQAGCEPPDLPCDRQRVQRGSACRPAL